MYACTPAIVVVPVLQIRPITVATEGAKVDGELAYGGEPIPCFQPPGGNGALHLVDDLQVEGHPALYVELDSHRHLCPLSTMFWCFDVINNYCHSVLIQF